MAGLEVVPSGDEPAKCLTLFKSMDVKRDLVLVEQRTQSHVVFANLFFLKSCLFCALRISLS